jgi:hypothetical protein
VHSYNLQLTLFPVLSPNHQEIECIPVSQGKNGWFYIFLLEKTVLKNISIILNRNKGLYIF